MRPNKLKHKFGAEKDLSKGPSKEIGWLVIKKTRASWMAFGSVGTLLPEEPSFII